ncbi:ADP-ribosylation factor-like protein 9 [Myripristis murdjan]|uniref:ADP-ribosylation factor-like 9 n=1 Tax=Myripristis murdjan TaxID=586833 RepID=A0A667XC83_9TELE|nr:ADP-ribosylation factor-like protein 9 [Myripristis murdjan]
MSGLRGVGLLGASVALAGGLAYAIWSYASSTPGGRKEEKEPEPETKPEGDNGAEQEEGGGGGGGGETEGAESVVAAAAAPVAAETPRDTESRPVERGTQVLVLGLDGAGKTSLLHCFATGVLEQDVQPTQGFNAVSIHREGLQIEFLEIGGREHLRPYWQRYMSKALLLVFVVDSSRAELFPLAKTHLHELLASDPQLPLVVLANKQDLPGACSITDLHDGLSLAEVGDQRKLFLIGTHVRRGDAELSSGVQDARDLIAQIVSDGR